MRIWQHVLSVRLPELLWGSQRRLTRPATLVTWPWLHLCMIYCCVPSQTFVTCHSCWLINLVVLFLMPRQDAGYITVYTNINGCRTGWGCSCLFLVWGWLNDHHRKWLSSTTTNRHGVAAFDYTTISVGDQLVVGPTMHKMEQLISWWPMVLT